MLRMLACLLISFCCVVVSGLTHAESPPNIVVILADDLGCCDMTLYNGWVKTPRIEQMAEQLVEQLDEKLIQTLIESMAE